MKRISWLLAICLTGCGGETAVTPIPQAEIAPTGPTVLMGDSITFLWGSSIPGYDAANPTVFEDVPGVIDAGVPGDTTDQMLARFDTDVLSHHPGRVVILGGTNDIRHLESPTTRNIVTMVQMAEAAGARVIVGMIPPINDWSPGMPPANAVAGNQEVADWNFELQSMAHAYGYTVVNYHDVMILPDGSQDATLFRSDRLHPDDAGYAVMWKVLAPLLH